MAQTRLKQLREGAVLTVHELAEASGVSDDTISKIENGQRVARPSTLRKLAGALDVSPQELRRPAKVEEPVPLPKAPREAGPQEEQSSEARSGSEVDTASEEEGHITRQSAESLKGHVERIKKLRELREAELEEIRKGMGPHARFFQMEMADKGLRDLMEELGVLAFAKGVMASRVLADHTAILLCQELLIGLAELEALTVEARVSHAAVESDIHVEGAKGASEIESQMQEGTLERRGTES